MMRLDDLLADKKPQPGAASTGMTGNAVETLEEERQMFGWDARPLIRESDDLFIRVNLERDGNL